MKHLLIVLSLAILVSGCTVGKNPTTQQVQDAQFGNAFIARSARLSFEALATRVEADRHKMDAEQQAQVNAAEDAIKGILNEMDQAATGDPNRFTQLVKDEAGKEFALWLNFQVIHLLIPK